MSNQLFKIFGTAVLGCAVLASCQDHVPNEDLIAEKAASINYEKAFNEMFPEIAPEQNWGFDPMPICGDNSDVTRGSLTNSNEWETKYHYVVPGGLSDNESAPWGWATGDITNYERAYVYWWFSTRQWPQTLQVNWTDFFVENVWGQPEHSGFLGDGTAFSASSVFGNDKLGMDFMEVLNKGVTSNISPFVNKITDVSTAMEHGWDEDHSGYSHINDFNSAGGSKEQVMYIYEQSSMDWFYRESRTGSVPFHNNWTVQYINGNYYLGFDYWCQKKDAQGYTEDSYSLMKPDGFYNDWIIKLFTGTHVADNYTRRIMCEDLGDTFDWDFNDLVFDVAIYNGSYGNGSSGYYAQITLQAAGGTLPIYIGEKDQAHEAHFLFGVDTNVPVNVDADGGVQRPAVVFHWPIPNDIVVTSTQLSAGGTVYSIDFKKIPIYVTRSDDPNATAIELTANKGEAPQKFACSSDTYWMKEFKNIETGHTNFAEWVKGTKTEAETFVTAESSNIKYAKVSSEIKALLFADNGNPYAGAYTEEGETPATIKPWKELWNARSNDALNSNYTALRQCPKIVDKDGNDYLYKTGYSTYTTTFEALAPNIYEYNNYTENSSTGDYNDPTALGAMIMNAVITGNYVDETLKWSPNSKFVILSTNNDDYGYVTGTGYYTAGSEVTVQAYPRDGIEFFEWEDEDGNHVGNGATYTFTLNSEIKLKAVFAPEE